VTKLFGAYAPSPRAWKKIPKKRKSAKIRIL
jgi:hypothetical protein